MMLIAATLVSMAIVTQEGSALRAAPRDSAAQHAALTPGDMLEIRASERMDYVQVYDHRRERAGFVRASQVRVTSMQAGDAPALLAVLRFVRDTPGAESLGIAYAAAYLKAAPVEAISAEPFDALGAMAERLARRATAARGKAAETATAQMESAASYGVVFKSYERGATIQLCYDGEAFRRVLALPSNSEERARAALALTRDDCIDPDLPAIERPRLDAWRADVLDRVDATQFAQLPESLKNRLRLRRADVWSTLAFQHARAGAPSQADARRALSELAAVNKTELADDDQADYNDAALRVGASRWAAEPVAPLPGRMIVRTEPGAPGETCVSLVDPRLQPAASMARRCTYGLAWTASTSISPNGNAVTLAVQPLQGWRELWLFRRVDDSWTIDVLPPGTGEPALGYVEFAGWVPGTDKLLLAREARIDGRHKRSFEVMLMEGLTTDRQASSPDLLALFGKWQDAAWKRQTVSLR